MALTPSLGGKLESEMQALLDCMCVSLAEAGWEGTCCLEAGVVDWSQCGEDPETGQPTGRAWAKLLSVYPSERFPAQSQPVDPTKCDVQWAMLVELGAMTYVCPEDCDCEVLDANAHLVLTMVEAGLAGIACCSEAADHSDVKVSGLTTVAVEDGCAGFTMQVFVPVQVCCTGVAGAPCA